MSSPCGIVRPLHDSLIAKYKKGVVINVVHMRMVAKIARAATKGVPKGTVEGALRALVDEADLSIEEAYNRVAWAYDLRTIHNQARSLATLIEALPPKKRALDAETRGLLIQLENRIKDLLAEGG